MRRAREGHRASGTLPPMPVTSRALPRALVLAVLAPLTLLVTLGLTASLATASPLAQGASDDATGGASDAGSRRVVEVLPLRGGFIDPPVTAQILDVLELAERDGSELVVLQYSSPGGVSVDVDQVLGAIEASPVPVAVLIGPIGVGAEAVGAAGLLWLAADVRAVSVDATVGPILPIDLSDREGDAADIATIAALVARDGGDEAAGARLADEALDADGLLETGIASVPAQSVEPLLLELDGTVVDTGGGERELRLRPAEVEVRFHSLGLVRRLLHAATTAPFIYLLLVVGLGMLLFEVFQPGFGVAGLAGIITAAIGAFGLTVLPVTWWAVALVVLGLLLYAVDTAIAGFGPVTLAATAAFVAGSVWFYDSPVLALNGWLIAATTLTVFVFFVFVMTTVLRAQAGPEGVAVDELVGRSGIVRSVLNPEGHVYIDGALWRARWTGAAKRAKVGTPVTVHAVDGPVVLVDAFVGQGPPPAVGPRATQEGARPADDGVRAEG
jgi:membrane-bound serine protease (ClpP class)